MDELWTAVDEYVANLLVPPDPALTAALQASEAAGLPTIAVSPTQGALLHILARSHGARTILEIGALGGYSTIWLARALPPGGRLITLEADPLHAEVARNNIARAGLAEVVDVRLGKALDTLPVVANAGLPAFDVIFIDADKPNIPAYFDWALQLSRPGTLIIVDNVVREGEIIDATSDDPSVQGVRRFMAQLAVEPRVTSTVMQTVGAKGYDGFAIALVTAPV
jgi:predicted O-methyltransferase YrrM